MIQHASDAGIGHETTVARAQSDLIVERNGSDGGSALDAAHTMPATFHGPGPTQLQTTLPGNRKRLTGHSFFRILDGRVSKHTVQGQRLQHDFLVQMYAAFSRGDSGDPDDFESVIASPAGMPLSWDTRDVDFQALVSRISFWSLYTNLDLPFLSLPQF